MTPRSLLIALVAALAFLSLSTGSRLAYTFCYALILLLLVSWAWATLSSRRVAVRRSSPTGRIAVGVEFEEHFELRNTGLLSMVWSEVSDHSGIAGYDAGRVCSLRPGEITQWTARGSFSRRGRHHFGPLEIAVSDPFGLFVARRRIHTAAEVIVRPQLLPVDAVLPNWGGISTSDQRRGRQLDVPPDVASVREYDSHDGQSRIHWLSSARTGKLMSRTYDTRQSADLLVMLDLEWSAQAGADVESTLEYGVTLAASIVHAAIVKGHAVGFAANDAHQTVFPAERGDIHEVRILDFLSEARANGGTPLATTIAGHATRWRGRGGLVIITPSRDPGWIAALLDGGSRGARHLAIALDAVSFGAPGPALRLPSSARQAMDWWVIRRGDPMVAPEQRPAVGQ